MRQVQRVPQHKGRHIPRCDRDRCRVEQRCRQYQRASGEHKVSAGIGQEKSLYNRRGPHAVFGGVQCAAQDAGGAAGIRGVHTGDYGAAEAAGNDTVKVYET